MTYAPVKVLPRKGLHILTYLLVLKQDQLLLGKRVKPDFLKGKWSLPWDHLQYGEHPDDSAKRIMQEQLGSRQRLKKPVNVFSYTKAHELIPGMKEHWDLCFIYRIQAPTKLRFDEQLVSEARFFTLKRLPSGFTGFQRYLVKENLRSPS